MGSSILGFFEFLHGQAEITGNIVLDSTLSHRPLRKSLVESASGTPLVYTRGLRPTSPGPNPIRLLFLDTKNGFHIFK